MRDYLQKFLRRALIVAALLGVCGYILAEVYLMTQQIYGAVPGESADNVRTRVPLNMVIMGLSLLVFMEMIALAFRRKKPAEPPRDVKDIPIPPAVPPNRSPSEPEA